MVRSVYIVGSAKQAFDTIVIPCAKITEYYLKRLPDDLFPKRMKGAGSFFDLECSYLSLNFYWNSLAVKIQREGTHTTQKHNSPGVIRRPTTNNVDFNNIDISKA